jgi:hypothetical protein
MLGIDEQHFDLARRDPGEPGDALVASLVQISITASR